MIVETILTGIFIFLTFLYISWFIFAGFSRTQYDKKINPSVSIIVPAYNEAPNIAKTIKSILLNKYSGKKEIIIINDGSTDKTGEIIKKFSKKNKEIKILNTNHLGKAIAINSAIKICKNEIFVILDADTEIDKNAIEEIVQPFIEKNVAAVSSTLRVKISRNILTWFQQFEYAISTGWRFVVDNAKGSCIVPGFCAFRKSALKKIGGLKGDTAVEDYDICMYLKKAGYEIRMVPTAIAYTRVPETISGWINQRVRWIRGTLQVIRKHNDVLFNRKYLGVGLYSIPTQMYWFFHAIIYLPLVFYQIFNGYWKWFLSEGEIISYNVVLYFVKWFTTYGMIDFIYNIAIFNYPLTLLNILTIIIFFLSFGFGFYCVLKFSKLNVYNIFGLLFFFPYTIIVLSVYLIATLYQLFERNRGEKWEKVH